MLNVMRTASLRKMALGLAASLCLAPLLGMAEGGNRPELVAWGSDRCAECNMVIGDPHHAAQLQLTDGHTSNFDDVGCLFKHLARRHPSAKAVWLRDSTSDRWLRPSEAAYARTMQTPMRYGFAVVPKGTAGAVSEREARATVLAGGRGATH